MSIVQFARISKLTDWFWHGKLFQIRWTTGRNIYSVYDCNNNYYYWKLSLFKFISVSYLKLLHTVPLAYKTTNSFWIRFLLMLSRKSNFGVQIFDSTSLPPVILAEQGFKWLNAIEWSFHMLLIVKVNSACPLIMSMQFIRNRMYCTRAVTEGGITSGDILVKIFLITSSLEVHDCLNKKDFCKN